jgi:ABC-2 type transport system ATP-binding protein
MEPVIRVQSISKSFARRGSRERVQAVSDVSFDVRRGEILGLLGPNGAGKTTTIKLICALLLPDSGRVTVNGTDTQRDRSQALGHISAVLEGNRNLYWRLTARENLYYFAGNRGRSRRDVKEEAERLLDQFGLAEKGNELVNTLSRGMQQKLAIAVALLARSEVVLLDEPTLGLDVETGYEVREILRGIVREGRTILLSTHDMSVVQDLCRRTVIINDGRVVVDDEIANLLRLFETRAYAIELAAEPGAEVLGRLQAAFPEVVVDREGPLPILRVELEHASDIDELIDLLRAGLARIEGLNRTTVNFEHVFRRLVREGMSTGEEVHAID